MINATLPGVLLADELGEANDVILIHEEISNSPNSSFQISEKINQSEPSFFLIAGMSSSPLKK